MNEHRAAILWTRGTQPFVDNRYSRRHTITFDGGAELPGSSSPHVVPVPYSDPAAVDPEEAFVGSIASCHMLWFLAIAARQQFRVDRYQDTAFGVMAPDAAGKLVVSVVTLRPEVTFSGERQPTRDDLDRLHHEAHEECFIANSVKSEIRCEPVYPAADGPASNAT